MSDNLYGDVLAAAPPVLAEAAIRRIHELLEAGADSVEVHEVATTSVALLNMHQRNRPGRKRVWLAKVTSFAFPRTFATAWGNAGEHYVCFTGSITKGGKQAVGREIEVQVTVDDAERLGQQMLRMVEFQRGQANQAGGQR
ncbi:hypothetical protein E6R18_24880 [Streptomyces sp. A1277]|uniref:hypothetical protein n=1 Tax=Streptomyces sp. A1277 TaxID=2563103 RepID=UPI0010A2273A|nr:hypothetical protein [Streptomyces sp. A1277]THA29149.1 hypothetical protein E6R18_24880 [Streptomyces sp. A1277]